MIKREKQPPVASITFAETTGKLNRDELVFIRFDVDFLEHGRCRVLKLRKGRSFYS